MAHCAEQTKDGRPCQCFALKAATVARWVERGILTTAQAGALVPPLRKHLRCAEHALRMLGQEAGRKVRGPKDWKRFDLQTVPRLQCSAIALNGARCRAKAMPPRSIDRLKAEGYPNARYGLCLQHAIKRNPDRRTLLDHKDQPWWRRLSFASAKQCEATCTAKYDPTRKHRKGKRCQQPAVKGKRVCRFHGGLTPSPQDKLRVKHGKTKQLWAANGRKSQRLALEYQKRREAGELLGVSHKPVPQVKSETPIYDEFRRRR